MVEHKTINATFEQSLTLVTQESLSKPNGTDLISVAAAGRGNTGFWR